METAPLQRGWEFAPLSIVVLGLVVIFALLFLFWRERRKVFRLQQRKDRVGWSRFRKAAAAWRLSSEQLALLEEMLRFSRIKDADSIFTNPSLFEMVVDHWIARHAGEKKGAAVRDLRENLGYNQLSPHTPLVSTRQLIAGERVRILFRVGEETVPTVIDQLDDFSWSVREVSGYRPASSEMVVVHYTRIGDGEYRIAASVRNRSKNQIHFEHSMEFEHFQMRSWVRIDLSIPAEVSKGEGRGTAFQKEIFPAWLTDLSGGGASFKTIESLEVGAVVELSFKMRNHHFSQIKSQIIRIQRDEELTTHSVEFMNLGTQDREKLIRLIFDRQRSARA